MRRTSCIAYFVLLCVACRRAGNPLDDTATSILKEQHVPGAAIAVVRDGRVEKEIVNGEASLQLHVPVLRTTVFQLASLTKVFSAAALMKLEQEGKLRLEDPVSKYLDRLPSDWGRVTLRELASHTSGLPDVITDANKPLSDQELARSEEDALQYAASRTVLTPPGTRFHYDQTNYVLLKRLVERVSGQEFHAYVTSAILQKDMPQTSWGDARVVVPGRADMYTALRGNRIENGSNLYSYPAYLDAAAGLNSNLADMEQFAMKITSERLLNATEVARMWEPAKDRDGQIVDIAKEFELKGVAAPVVGWFFADNSGGQYPRVFMTGGSSTALIVFPKQRLCIVVLTNLQAKDDPLTIGEEIAKYYLPAIKTLFRPCLSQESGWVRPPPGQEGAGHRGMTCAAGLLPEYRLDRSVFGHR